MYLIILEAIKYYYKLLFCYSGTPPTVLIEMIRWTKPTALGGRRAT